MVTIAAQTVYGAECVVYQFAIGRIIALDKDAMEALFEAQAIMTKTSSVTRAETGEIIRKHPHAVATPFPPSRKPR